MARPLFFVFTAAAVTSWFVAVGSTWTMMGHVHPDAKTSLPAFAQGMNLLFYPSALTAEGRRVRRRVMIGGAGFAFFLVLAVLTASFGGMTVEP